MYGKPMNRGPVEDCRSAICPQTVPKDRTKCLVQNMNKVCDCCVDNGMTFEECPILQTSTGQFNPCSSRPFTVDGCFKGSCGPLPEADCARSKAKEICKCCKGNGFSADTCAWNADGVTVYPCKENFAPLTNTTKIILYGSIAAILVILLLVFAMKKSSK
jgi:hypothetical protein